MIYVARVQMQPVHQMAVDLPPLSNIETNVAVEVERSGSCERSHRAIHQKSRRICQTYPLKLIWSD